MRLPCLLVATLGWLALVAACASPAAPTAPANAPAAANKPAAAPTSASAPAAPAAPAKPPEKLRVGFSNVTAAHAGLWAAEDGGGFQRNGLDVELFNVGASQAVQASLLSREVLVASVSGSSTVNVRLAGGDLVMIGASFDTMPYQLASIREVASLPDLRGKSIGINRFGGAADSILRYLLRNAGVDPDRETTILQVGAQNERVAALRSGAIQATLVDPPFSAIAEREGLRVILDTAELGIAYPQDVLVASREWIGANRDTARRVLAGLREGLRGFKTEREMGKRSLQRWLQFDDPAMLDDTYTYFARFLPDDVIPRPEGIQLVIDEVAAELPQARELRYDDLVDTSLARELR